MSTESKRLTTYIDDDEEKQVDLNHNDVSKMFLDVEEGEVKHDTTTTTKHERGKVQWVVVLSGMYVMMLWGAFSRCYPVLYYPLMEDLEVNFEQVSTLSAWFFGAYAISAGYTSLVCKILGYRVTVMALGLMSGVALFAASFATDQTAINLLVGFVPGLALGPCIIVYSTGIMQTHSDMLANVLLQVYYIGSAISPIFGAPLLQATVHHFGARGTFRLLGGVFLQIVVLGALIKFNVEDTDSRNNDNETTHTPHHDGNIGQRCMNPVVSRIKWFFRQMHLELFIDPKFVTFALMTCFYVPGFFSSITFLMPYGREKFQLEDFHATFLVSGFTIGDTVSKILYGLFYARLPKTRRLLFICLSLFVVGCIFTNLMLAKSFVALLVVSIALGLVSGGIIGSTTKMIMDSFDSNLIGLVLGYDTALCYAATSVTQTLLSWATEYYETAAVAFVVGCIFNIIASFLQFIFYRLDLKSPAPSPKS